MLDFSTDPKVQRDIATVADMLRALPIGGLLTYTAIAQATGRHSPYVIQKARAEVEKAEGVRFATQRTVGVVKLSAEDVSAIGVQGIRRLHKGARRVVARLSDLRGYNDIPHEERIKIAGARMIAVHVAEETGRTAVKQAAETVRTVGTEVHAAARPITT